MSDRRLNRAAEEGDLQLVQKLIEKKGCDPHAKGDFGWTPLHRAARYGHQLIVEYLIKNQKCDPNCRDYVGQTPLHLACVYGHQSIVEYMAESKLCDLNCRSNIGQTPLHYACRYGHRSIVEYMAESKLCDLNCRDDVGRTPLHWACRNGHQSIVEYMAENKLCDLNSRDDIGRTPLHYACQNGHQSSVEYMAKNKLCDLNCRDKYGQTPLHLACKNGRQSSVEYMAESKLCDLNCRDEDGRTPLHWACRNGHQSIVEYMAESKLCDLNCRDEDGRTPLHWACRNGHQSIVEYFAENKLCDLNCRNKYGETPLHFACQHNRTGVTIYLLSKKCDPNVATKDGRTPLSLTRDATIVRELIVSGAKAELTFRKCLPDSYSKEPASSAVKTFIFGDPNAGKTTLTAAIKSESSGIVPAVSGRLFKVLKTDDRTAGIVPHHFESRQFGSITLYDFAGQREFYSSHDALLQSSVPGETAVYLVVADLSKSDEEFRRCILYWIHFIGNQKSSSKQHVIVVGSHADQVRSKEDKARKAAIVDSLSSSESFASFHLSGFVAVDCRYARSDPMGRLRQHLRQSYEVLRNTGALEIRTHCFLVYLLEKNPNTPAITLGSVVAVVETEENKKLVSYFSHDIHHLVAMCEQLSVRGNILFFGNPSNPADSTIVLDQAALFTRVTGTVFAPKSFKEHASLANSTGVVPFSKLASQFPDLDSNMIAQFMCHLEFCHEVSDPEVLHLLQTDRTTTAEERFFFFPGLVSIQAPGRVWEQADRFTYHCGWQLQCTQPEHFLTTRFLQVLILRLAFSFALAPCPTASCTEVTTDLPDADVPTVHRRCTVWKNGMCWANGYGAEALVEVSTDSKRVTVLVRGKEGYLKAATELQSGVIRSVFQAKNEFCSAISCHESLLDSSSSSLYPPSSSATGVPISAVAEAVARTQPFIVLDSDTVRLQELLGFEPYANLGEPLLRELFDEDSQHYNEPLKDEFIYRIAEKAHLFIDLFVEMLALRNPVMLENRLSILGLDGPIHRLATAIQLWRGDYRTIRHLREKLDQFSVFAGRNPLAIAQKLL